MSERLTVEQERLLVRAIRDRAGLSPAERDEALGLALRELQAARARMAELEHYASMRPGETPEQHIKRMKDETDRLKEMMRAEAAQREQAMRELFLGVDDET